MKTKAPQIKPPVRYATVNAILKAFGVDPGDISGTIENILIVRINKLFHYFSKDDTTRSYTLVMTSFDNLVER